MEDLVPFLIFIVIALVNLVKYILEKGAGTRKTPAEPARGPQRREPASLEEFFETLAEKMGPKPTELPEWPEGYERPDYMQEAEQYETARVQTDEGANEVKSPSAAKAEPIPTIPEKPVKAAGIKVAPPRAALKSAMKSLPVMSLGTKGMHMKTPPILRSSTGRTDFPLENKTDLKNAIIANIIFSQPRAYDTAFENSIIK